MTTPAAPTAATPLTPPAAAVHGRFVWHDYMARDVDRATAFYPRVTGWGLDTFAAEGRPPYTMWTIAGRSIGGVMALTPEERARGAAPFWLPYIGADDVDAAVAQALALGATGLVPPTDIPSIGRFAILADPQGAPFAMFTPLGGPVTPWAPKVGDVSWYELPTSDGDAAFAFYSKLFGWEQTDAMDMGPMGVYRLYGKHGDSYGGMFTRSPAHAAAQGAPRWLLYVQVPDLERALDTVRAAGGTVTLEPHEVPGGGRIAQCVDPDGASFALHVAGK